MSKDKQSNVQMTLHEATHNLLHRLGLTTVFGNPLDGATVPEELSQRPTFETDQEPEKTKYVPTATLPTDLMYAVRISRAPVFDGALTLELAMSARPWVPGL